MIDFHFPFFLASLNGFLFQVKRTGLAYRAGIRINDIITRINNVYTEDMTLREAQRLIRKSGKYVQIFVLGYVSIH